MRTVDLSDVVETIGRSSDNSIQIQDRFLSRYHAHLVRVPDPQTDSYTYCVFDGGREVRTPSKNGVYVNGMQVRSHLLKPGDVVFLGPSVRLFFYPLTVAAMLMQESDSATDPALLSLKR
jgi:pSer/pThr/pTyr-binding forkhead associated (FHA) protein